MSTFHELHSTLLILPNAWDAGSARLFEHAGARAIATTSAGMAWSLGYPDGYKLPVDEVLHSAALIRAAVKIPVSIDIENGYADDPSELALKLIALGIAGINIEDGSEPPAILARKIEAIKTAASKRGYELFINARCDVYLRNLVPDHLPESIARGKLYREAGADGFFVPGIKVPDQIRAVVDAIPLPVNVLATAGLPDGAALSALGVRRLSAGSAIAQLMNVESEQRARAFLATGSSDAFARAMPYGELQKLFVR
ncbi:MAG: isocitrate lyase/phosphoenolpyruvate mutase family protein [Kofleriaceae bacterium]